MLRRLQCWLMGDHEFESDYELPELNGKCVICGARLRGNYGAYNVWRHLTPPERARLFGRD